MKPTGYFINIRRGHTSRFDDPVTVIENGVIAGCALDLFAVKPLPAEHKLSSLPNVLLTPRR